MRNSKAKGFTLIELIVVIAIIGVLAAILVPAMMGYLRNSRISRANANAKIVYNAVAAEVSMAAQSGTVLTGTPVVSVQAGVAFTAITVNAGWPNFGANAAANAGTGAAAGISDALGENFGGAAAVSVNGPGMAVLVSVWHEDDAAVPTAIMTIAGAPTLDAQRVAARAGNAIQGVYPLNG